MFNLKKMKKEFKQNSLLKKSFLKSGLFYCDFKSNCDNKRSSDNLIKNKEQDLGVKFISEVLGEPTDHFQIRYLPFIRTNNLICRQ